MTIKKILLPFLLVIFIPFNSFAATDVEFLLDASGSMAKITGGERQIDSAKTALVNSLGNIPADAHVALRFYGHRVEQTDKQGSCTDTEVVVPFGPLSETQIRSAINPVRPKGYTPIAYSLEQAAKDFDISREAKKVIILLSDGEETCDGDALAVLKKLKEQGFEVVVHTIGFNVDAVTRAQLEGIANASGGEYFDAKNANELTAALKEATQQSFLIEKSTEDYTFGKPIRGGDAFDSAVAIDFKTDYKLDHHQKKAQYDFFSITTDAPTVLTLTAKTAEKGLKIREGREMEENDDPMGTVSLLSGSREELLSTSINQWGAKNNVKSEWVYLPDAGKYIVSVGDKNRDIHKDGFIFSVSTESVGDIESKFDAGEESDTALAIETNKKYENNFLMSGFRSATDKKDVFYFEAKENQKYELEFRLKRLSEHLKFRRVQIMDTWFNGVAKSDYDPRGGIVEFESKKPGKYYIIFSSYWSQGNSGNPFEIYSFELKEIATTKSIENEE